VQVNSVGGNCNWYDSGSNWAYAGYTTYANPELGGLVNPTVLGNGYAKPAVAKDSLTGYEQSRHNAFWANDGRFGNSASWIGVSAWTWLKIDLGRSVTFSRIKFGRDQSESKVGDRPPGHFKIWVASNDAIYATGDESNDATEYTLTFDSTTTSPAWPLTIPAGNTALVSLGTTTARFVKLGFEYGQVCIDEVEVLP